MQEGVGAGTNPPLPPAAGITEGKEQIRCSEQLKGGELSLWAESPSGGAAGVFVRGVRYLRWVARGLGLALLERGLSRGGSDFLFKA